MHADEDMEFGGYLSLEPQSRSLYHDDAVKVNSGRHALAYLIEARGISRLWLPDYLCDSVAAISRHYDVELLSYPIGDDLRPATLPVLDDSDWLYIVNYFGVLEDNEISDLHARAERLIVDNTQAFFERPLPGIDTIYTCRKFFGVADGGFLYTDARLKRSLPVGRSAEWMAHVLGRAEDSASAHYPTYRENEARLAHEELTRMSSVTETILRTIDYDAVIRARKQNFTVLERRLGRLNELTPSRRGSRFAYPFLVNDGERIRPHLHARKAYVPMLWPNVISETGAGAISNFIARNLLPLPIDQRYSPKDMHRLADILEEEMR